MNRFTHRCGLFLLLSIILPLLGAHEEPTPGIYYQTCHGEVGIAGKTTVSPLDQSMLIHVPGKQGFSYSVSFLDVNQHTGAGFDDPTRGASRRQVAIAALDYMSSIIQNKAGVLEVQFELSTNNPDLNVVAFASTLYQQVNGFTDALAAIKLIQGTDVSSALPDFSLTVNFGLNINDDLSTPESNEFDLFTVLIHEILHGLGATSLINNAQGESAFQSSNFKTFTRWDSRLTNTSGTPLWTSSGNVQVSTATFVGSDGGVVFRGPTTNQILGSYPKIYTPASFSLGSSIRHWDDSIVTANLLPINFPGVSLRTLTAFERGMLEDLGFKTATRLLYCWISNNTGNFESTIVLNNFGSETASVTFTARRADGQTETTQPILVPARGFLQQKAASLFPGLGSGPGYTVVAESSVDTVAGRFITNDSVNLAPSQGDAVPLPTTGLTISQVGTSVAFGFLPVTNGFFSAPVYVNVGTEAATVTMYFYKASGERVAVVTQSNVVPLRPTATLTSTLVPNLSEDVYMVATSTQPLTGVIFVFNNSKQTAIGNTTAIPFTP